MRKSHVVITVILNLLFYREFHGTFVEAIAIDNGLVGFAQHDHPVVPIVAITEPPELPTEPLILRYPNPNNHVGDRICMTNSKADMAFVLDTSSSVGDDFPLMQQFFKNVISGFTISPTDVQVAAVTYNADPISRFSFATSTDTNSVLTAIDAIPYDEGKTNTGKAIQYTLDTEFSEAQGHRPDAQKILVVVTDGSSQDDVAGAAATAVANNVDMFAVAITPDVNDEELMQITNNKPNRIFKVDRFTDLQQELRNKLVEEICQTVSGTPTNYTPPPPPTTPPTTPSPLPTTPPPTQPTAPPQPAQLPNLICSPDSITFTAQAIHPFQGRIFVKGYSSDPACVVNANTAGTPSRDIEFTVMLSSCGVQKVRGGQPGVSYETTIIVSFHPHFITKVDKAFRMKCFFMEAEKTVTSAIDVSMITTNMVSTNVPMPTCEYSIRDGSPNGPPIRYSNVGQKLFHVWKCTTDDPSIYRMLVKDCTVKNGKDGMAILIDDRGCMTDKHLISDLIYDPNELLAYQETHAFKFADISAIHFHCSIALCLTANSQCDGVTPPRCVAISLSQRAARGVLTGADDQEMVEHTLNARQDNVSAYDVFSSVVIFDIDEPEFDSSAGVNRLTGEPQGGLFGRYLFCLQARTVAFAGIGCVSITAFGLTVVISAVRHRNLKRNRFLRSRFWS